MRRAILDVTVLRGTWEGTLDQFLLLTKVKMTEKEVQIEEERREYVISVGWLRNSEAPKEYERQLGEKLKGWRKSETEDVGRMGKDEIGNERGDTRSMKRLGR